MIENERHEQSRKQFEYYLSRVKPGKYREPIEVKDTVMLDPVKGWIFPKIGQ